VKVGRQGGRIGRQGRMSGSQGGRVVKIGSIHQLDFIPPPPPPLEYDSQSLVTVAPPPPQTSFDMEHLQPPIREINSCSCHS
jgi:hypothetical protein